MGVKDLYIWFHYFSGCAKMNVTSTESTSELFHACISDICIRR